MSAAPPTTGRKASCSIQLAGNMVLAGTVHDVTSTEFALAGFDGDGGLDVDFGTAGRVTTDFVWDMNQVGGAVIDPNGRIVVAGYSHQFDNSGVWTGYDFAVARYFADGSLDTSFGSGGKVTTDFGLDHDMGRGVAIDAAGRIVVVGDTEVGASISSLWRATTATARSTPPSTATEWPPSPSVQGIRLPMEWASPPTAGSSS